MGLTHCLNNCVSCKPSCSFMDSKIFKGWITDNATHVSPVSSFSVQGSGIFIRTDTVWCLNFSWECCIWDVLFNLKWGAGLWSHLCCVCDRVCALQSWTAGYQTASPRRQHSFVQFWLCSWLINWILGTVVGQMSTAVTITRLLWSSGC